MFAVALAFAAVLHPVGADAHARQHDRRSTDGPADPRGPHLDSRGGGDPAHPRARHQSDSSRPAHATSRARQHHSRAHAARASPRARHVRSGGAASWYGAEFNGRRTANGERYNMDGLTAAHRSLPFGTHVKVTNRSNGRSVVVRINDRGPFHGGRVIDLSRGAASTLGMMGAGTARVSLEVQRR